MRATVVLVDPGGARRWATAEWAGPATLGQLLTAAGLPVRADASVAVDSGFYGVEAPLDFVRLHDGSTVSLSAQRAEPFRIDLASELHVAVIAGPCAGLMVPVRSSTTSIGSDTDGDVVLADPEVAPRHAVLHRNPDGSWTLEPRAPGVTVEGVAAPGPVLLEPAQAVALGRSMVELRPGTRGDAVADEAETVHELRRPPRLRPPAPEVRVRWPDEPEAPTRQPVPLAALLAPLAIGVVLFLVTKTIYMLLFIGLTPILTGANFVSSRRSGKIFHRKAMAEYKEAMVKAEAKLADHLRREWRLRAEAAPDAATAAATALGPRRALWERRRTDGDFLHLRLGVATLPAATRREAPIRALDPLPPVDIHRAPAVLSLCEVGVVGVGGEPGFTQSMAGWLVAQAAVHSGPADLSIVVLTEESAAAEERWSWARWLPHTLSSQPGGPSMFGTTSESVQSRIAELVDLIATRQSAGQQSFVAPTEQRSKDWPNVLVVIDPVYDLRRLPGVDVILRAGPAVGVMSICVDAMEGYLPVECQATVTCGPDGKLTLAARDRAILQGIVADAVTPEWLTSVGRSLADLRDPESVTESGAIPSSVRLVDLLGLDRLDAAGVLDAWSLRHRTTSAVVGAGPNGAYALDLRIDGPHGLVAGTTGAGKSEFLQTLIASLAAANRHDAMSFLLVDYKGGSAFRDCARLPHTVGVVTDLDGHLTARALESLSAELKRREEILAEGNAKDIDDYIALGEPVGALPRLLIVIDEFAGLVAELPDFVTGLVGIAQRGRSLGIHMILATQRPSGVVSPEIRANTNLRVALRVTSPAESADVIDAPDAARIMPTTPGRALSRTGHSALTPFQSARVGGPAGPAVTEQGPEIAVCAAGWDAAGDAPRLARVDRTGHVDPTDTDLARLASVLVEAADRSGIPRQPRPWLPPLPEVLRLSDLPTVDPAEDGLMPARFALVDLPATQRQMVMAYHPSKARHLAVVGGPGTGRTTALRTIALGLADANQPEDLWLYAIDCGGGELRRLAQLPHTGAVVTRTETERASRLLTRLHEEMNRRLELLATEGYTDVAEQRAAVGADHRLPYIMVLVDRWEGFLTTFDLIDNQRLTDLLIDLGREGGAAGIRLVVSGDRSTLTGRLAATIDDRICLSLPDRNDFSFVGIDSRKVPETMGPGRAVRAGDAAELQFAVVGDGASGQSQAAAVADLVQAWRDRGVAGGGRRRPFRVDTLPAEVSERAARELLVGAADAEGTFGGDRVHTALLGVGGDELGAVTVDVAELGGFMVAGPRRSGRSTTLILMARSLLANGCEVIAFCPRQSPLHKLAGTHGVLAVFEGDDPPIEEVGAVLNSVTGPLAVVIDDASALQQAPIAELLTSVSTDGPRQGHVLLVAGVAEELMRPSRGFIYQTAQNRSGLLLCPERHTDGELLGAQLTRSAVFRGPVGRGILVGGPAPMTIQVAAPDE